MTLCLRISPLRASATKPTCLYLIRSSRQLHSPAGGVVSSIQDVPHEQPQVEKMSPPSSSCLAHLPMSNLVRNIFLGTVFASPIIFNPSMAIMKIIANSQGSLFNPDKNPLLRAMVKPILYRHFCGGENTAEVRGTVRQIKDLGFSGVILANGREIFFNEESSSEKSIDLEADVQARMRQNVATWYEDNLQTLDMISKGDILAMKFTGAGPEIANLLALGAPMPECLQEAMDNLCERARTGGKRIWVDAEQRKIQPTIDDWVLGLMRQYNTHGDALVMNTVQAYLKSSRDLLTNHLRLAQKEGWTLGVKLVRGAYIASEERSVIHDTKADTDASYNGIVKDILTKSWPGFSRSDFPSVGIFLAGHNQESVRRASDLARQLAHDGEKVNIIGFGQLLGMADEVSCNLLAERKHIEDQCNRGMSEEDAERIRAATPRAFKCLPWGSVQECMQYLVRRATENRGAADRINESLPLFRRELWRRITTRSM